MGLIKTCLAAFGLFHLVLMILGCFDVIDYHLCVDKPSVCHIVKLKGGA